MSGFSCWRLCLQQEAAPGSAWREDKGPGNLKITAGLEEVAVRGTRRDCLSRIMSGSGVNPASSGVNPESSG